MPSPPNFNNLAKSFLLCSFAQGILKFPDKSMGVGQASVVGAIKSRGIRPVSSPLNA